MENIGYADWTSSALHGPGYSADGNIGARQTYPNGGRADQWHTYAVEWTPTALRFYVDDRLVQETSRTVLESTRGQWVYDHNQYVILNLALGGAYPAGWNKATTRTGACPSPAWTASRAGECRRRWTGCGWNRSGDRHPRACPASGHPGRVSARP